jgi:hypothetical protein
MMRIDRLIVERARCELTTIVLELGVMFCRTDPGTNTNAAGIRPGARRCREEWPGVGSIPAVGTARRFQ